jgi:DNA-binding response OmpR family regulator
MKTILIVEDDFNLGNLYKMELEEDGYRVVLARDRDEAYEKFSKERPDVAVIDIRLPRSSGIDLSLRMASEDRNMRIVINTGFEEFKSDFHTWVADAYLVKSSDLSKLKKTIEGLLVESTAAVDRVHSGRATGSTGAGGENSTGARAHRRTSDI